MQHMYIDRQGVTRFARNFIVEYLWDFAAEHGMDINKLAMMEFNNNDWQQIWQLLGYSFEGYLELSSVDEQAAEAALEEARKAELRERERGKK